MVQLCRLHCILAATAVQLITVQQALATPTFYSCQPLGQLVLSNTTKGTLPAAVNNLGQVAGYSYTNPTGYYQELQGFYWANGQMTALPGVPSIIDNTGRAAGSLTVTYPGNPNGYYYAYVWSNGTLTQIQPIGSGPLPGYLDNAMTQVTAMNDSGLFAGGVWNYSGGSKMVPVVGRPGAYVQIVPTPDLTSGYAGGTATGINASGQVIGSYENSTTGSYYPFFWYNNAFQAIGKPGQVPNSLGQGTASVITNTGQVIGWGTGYGPQGNNMGTVAWSWLNGTLTMLPGLGADATGRGSSTAYAVNGNGWVAGSSTKYSSTGSNLGTRGVIWHDNQIIEIPCMGLDTRGAGTGDADQINSSGQVIGSTEKFDAAGKYLGRRGFFYADGQTIFFDSPSPRSTDGYAWSTADLLAEDGKVFGSYLTYSGTKQSWNRAFVWSSDTGMLLLDDLIAGGLDRSHWDHLESVTSISDDGKWLAGEGITVDGHPEAFLLQVAPEPTTLLSLAAGVVMLMRRRPNDFKQHHRHPIEPASHQHPGSS